MGVFVYCFVVDFVVFVWWTKVNVERECGSSFSSFMKARKDATASRLTENDKPQKAC